jgi:Zn-dependent protease
LLNLMPVPPLDGLALLGLVLPGDVGVRIRQGLRSPGPAIVGLLAVWMLFPRIFGPIFREVAALLYAGAV